MALSTSVLNVILVSFTSSPSPLALYDSFIFDFSTITFAVADNPLSVVAFTVVVPALHPFTSPDEFTVAMLSSVDFHVSLAVAPFGSSFAFIIPLYPFVIVSGLGDSVIEVGGNTFTFTSQISGAAMIGSTVILA